MPVDRISHRDGSAPHGYEAVSRNSGQDRLGHSSQSLLVWAVDGACTGNFVTVDVDHDTADPDRRHDERERHPHLRRETHDRRRPSAPGRAFPRFLDQARSDET